jgi:hypothetical protein
MRLKIRPEDVSAHEMGDWIAWLRAEMTEETGDGETWPETAVSAEPDGGSAASGTAAAPAPSADTSPASVTALAPVPPAATAAASVTAVAPALPADGPPTWVKTVTSAEHTCRAVIGDELRIPIAWCEMGSCISHHTDPAALGNADIRARAQDAGWRPDRFGRLVCVDCQQTNPWFRTAYPVVLWNREAAVATAATMTASLRDHRANGTVAAPPAELPAAQSAVSPPAWQWSRGRHRKHP